MFYFVLGNELWKKKGHPSSVILAEIFPQNVLFDGLGWWVGGLDGVPNGSFNFLHTLWVYRHGIYLVIHVVKNCYQHSYGFENLMSCWGVGILFSKRVWGNVFLKNHAKSKMFQKHQRQQASFELFFPI